VDRRREFVRPWLGLIAAQTHREQPYPVVSSIRGLDDPRLVSTLRVRLGAWRAQPYLEQLRGRSPTCSTPRASWSEAVKLARTGGSAEIRLQVAAGLTQAGRPQEAREIRALACAELPEGCPTR
jgi:hypothetical protein